MLSGDEVITLGCQDVSTIKTRLLVDNPVTAIFFWRLHYWPREDEVVNGQIVVVAPLSSLLVLRLITVL